MFADKYPSIFSPQMETIVYLLTAGVDDFLQSITYSCKDQFFASYYTIFHKQGTCQPIQGLFLYVVVEV